VSRPALGSCPFDKFRDPASDGPFSGIGFVTHKELKSRLVQADMAGTTAFPITCDQREARELLLACRPSKDSRSDQGFSPGAWGGNTET